MIDGQKVLLTCATHDGNVCAGFAGGVGACAGLLGGVAFISGNSHVALARNCQAAAFLASPFEWMLSIDADIQFVRRDMEILLDGDEQIVAARYAKKELNETRPAAFGLGFARIHRGVFDALKELKYEGDADDPNNGAPLIGSFFWQGQVMDDYFPSGPDMGSHWVGEDHGFFSLCHRAGVTARDETRCKLIHWGRHGYAYDAPSDATVSDVPI